MVSVNWATSPREEIDSFCLRLPVATDVTTLAIPRTWLVRLDAIMFTESVRSFQVTPPPLLPRLVVAQFALRSHFPRHTRDFVRKGEFNWSTIVLMVFFISKISPFTSIVTFLDRSPEATALVTSAMLRTWLVRFPVI